MKEIEEPRPFVVYDKFLRRRQIRWVSTQEFIELAGKTPACLTEMAQLWEVVNPAVFTNILPEYGSENWR